MAEKVLVSPSLVDENMSDLISDLQNLIRHPSISAINYGLEECAELLSNMMNKAGINTERLYLDQFDDDNSREGILNIPPLVFGEVKSKSNPYGKTILFYNHYDVQPLSLI